MWSFAAFFLWMIIAVRIWPPQPPQAPDATTTQPAAQEPGALTAPGPDAATGTSSAATEPTSVATTVTGLTARGADFTASATLGSVEGGTDSEFRMQLELTGRGAAINSAILADFALHVGTEERYHLLNSEPDTDGRQFASLAVEKIAIDGQEVAVSQVDWVLDPSSRLPESAVFSLEIVDSDQKPILQLTRSYRLDRQPADAKRYDLQADLLARNVDDRSHELVMTFHGPVGLRREGSRMDNRAVSVATRDGDAVELTSQMFAKIVQQERPLFNAHDGPPLWWIAVDNKFFTCLVAPLDGDTQQEGPGYLTEARAVDLDGDAETTNDVTARFMARLGNLPAGGQADFPMACYLGPKDREVFSLPANEDYVRRDYGQLISRMYTWCTFSWLAEFMIVLLDALHRVVFNYGVAIVILVLVVRTLLHPLTKKGQVNMMKMQKQMGKLAPKMEELKKKHANDKARLQQEMQKLYHSEGFNPAGQMFTCLPMFIQMPIWVALWTSLNNNIAMRHQPFVLWMRDLTAPDALISFSGEYHVPLLGSMIGPVTALNLLPILLSVTMYLQQKLMPKPKPPAGQSSSQSDQAAMMQKMMPIMSIFFGLILYNAPSGLTLYIMASTLFGTLEQWRIRKHIKEMEANGGLDAAAGATPRGPWGPLWWQRLRRHMGDQARHLQKQAEDAQRLRSKKR